MNDVKLITQEAAADRISPDPVLQLELFPRTFGGTAWLPELPVECTPSREFVLPPSTPGGHNDRRAGRHLCLRAAGNSTQDGEVVSAPIPDSEAARGPFADWAGRIAPAATGHDRLPWAPKRVTCGNGRSLTPNCRRQRSPRG